MSAIVQADILNLKIFLIFKNGKDILRHTRHKYGGQANGG